MSKRLSIVVPAALVAGGVLLTACGPESAGSPPPPSTTITTTTTTTTSSTVSSPESSTSDSTSSSQNGVEPVYCGEVTLDTGAIHGLTAVPAENGIVGCTEAFNVLDEFLKLPPEKRSEASLGNVQLASGWSCTVDDGISADISCQKDGFALHTEQQAG
jgi:hypothetical protein